MFWSIRAVADPRALVRACAFRYGHPMYPLGDRQAYASWARDHDQLSDADRAAIRQRSAGLKDVLFSIIIPAPACGAGLGGVRAAASVRAQLCASWELLAPAALLDGPDSVNAAGGGRSVPLAEDLDLVALCTAALARAAGAFVIFLLPDTVLAEHALFEFALAATDPGLAMIYADEDRIDTAGRRSAPRFRTAWDPDFALSGDAGGPTVALCAATVRASGGLRPAASPGLALYDLMLRLGTSVLPSQIRHVPAILSHRDAAFETGDGTNAEATRAVVERHLAEAGVADVTVGPAPLLPSRNRIRRALPSPAPLVSVVVPTRDRADLLARCADGVLRRTAYDALELLIVDNDSAERATGDLFAQLGQDARVRILHHAGLFNFPAMNNRAVREARGDVVVLLNNDTDVIDPDWLVELVSHALRPDVGAVGAKLLYADGRVQHCGITLGPGWMLTHQLRLSDRFDPGPNGELALTRTVLAVTGACMAFRKAVFLEVGGLDEENFRVAFNDVDFCLRLGDHGYRVVCTPFAELLHLESVTRGHDDTPEKQAVNRREAEMFRRLWSPLLDADPFHNPHVVFRWEDSVLAGPPRRPRPWMDTVAS